MRLIPVLLLVSVAVVSGSASAGGVTAGQLKVTSTLSGKTAIPHRVRWVATVKPASTAAKVLFIIDGKVRWIETNAPYVYGDDSDWLVTSWLSKGRHTFIVRAVASDGSRAEAATTAAVAALPRVPPGLANSRWGRGFTKAETGDAPPGKWAIAITPAGWRIADPAGGANFIDVAYLPSGIVETRGGIWTRPREDQEPNVQEGNGWCEDSNAPVKFSWKIVGDELTLNLVGPSRCDGLGAFLSKTWKRAP